ncbi:hypothetical protein [Cyclobacterium salsum]|uniref:hypothetical protein n=1 Tax=Cyclobacterium salsum TaxID=2666329 RepID=UPI001391BDBA|nr:hypothetical protein [Cyclobacterium salsum]
MKWLLVIAILIHIGSANAQHSIRYMQLGTGMGIPLLNMGALGFEFASRNYQRYEVMGEWMEVRENGYQTILGGFMIKPVMYRKNTSSLRFRWGTGFGTDFTRFLLAPILGWEFSLTIYQRMKLTLGNRNQLLLWAPRAERWRVVLDAGIKIPLN